MANKRMKVRRQSIVACITCPLCTNLLVEATTISLCLHTFCRICIYKKLADDAFDTCPVCDINLGCNPVEKLRPDHNLQHIRAKIFPVNIRRGKDPEAPEAVPSVSPPAKRKERSLSSLVGTPSESVHNTSATGRRSRPIITNSPVPSGSSLCIKEHPEEDLLEDHVETPSCSETLNKTIQKNYLDPSVESLCDQNSDERMGNRTARLDAKVDLRNPSNCLVDVANGTKFLKSTSRGPARVKAVPSSAHVVAIPNVEEKGHKTKIQDDKNDIPSAIAPTKRKRGRPPNRNTKKSLGESPNSVPVAVRRHHQNVPIWFSLVASEDRKGAAHLPQISSAFLRIKDNGMPVSVIQKYIAKRLELLTEEEVQITFQGKPVPPTHELGDLLELWRKAAPACRRIETNVGNSGKDYVMVLKYSRKSPAQTSENSQIGLPLESLPTFC